MGKLNFSIRAFFFELLPVEQLLMVGFGVFVVCNFEDILKEEFYRIQLCVGVLRGLEDNIDIWMFVSKIDISMAVAYFLEIPVG